MALSIHGDGDVLFVFSPVLSRSQRTNVAQPKDYSASWLLSADTATKARASKAIAGRFYDAGVLVLTCHGLVSVGSID
jgi:hypothetical protein